MKKIVVILILIFSFPDIILARSDSIEVKFSECTDGDTAKVIYQNEEIKIRFLAIDTPETKHPTTEVQAYGQEASDFTCSSLQNAKKITLEFDPNSDELDKYNRYLVWIFIDDNNLQYQLVEKGYAKVAYIYGDYKYLSELKELEKTAKKEKLGIWSDYTEQPDYTIYYIIGGILLVVILTIIISTTNNKYIKKEAKKGKSQAQKFIKKIIKKL